MSRPKRERYHHGDLREALVATAVELIADRGVRNFSLAEASRRLGVAASAPYAHFEDRDALLAAVGVHALELFRTALEPALARASTPRERLAAIARTYVTFAGAHEALFQALFQLQLDKGRHPELASAELPIEEAFLRAVSDVFPGHTPAEETRLAAAVEAVAHGHATLLLDGRFGRRRRAAGLAARSAARSVLAVADGWK